MSQQGQHYWMVLWAIIAQSPSRGYMPSPSRFTEPCYTLLTNLQSFSKSTKIPGIFISQCYKVTVIHRLCARVFPCQELNPEETQHIQINTETHRQGQPPHNTLMLLLNTKNQAFLFLSFLFRGKYTWKREAFQMRFSPSGICRSSCSGSLHTLQYCWFLSNLNLIIYSYYVENCLARKLQIPTENLQIISIYLLYSKLKPFRVKTDTKFRQWNKYKAYGRQLISELVL